jgi:UDP-GlcNAc:undecaprenyl-phosphate GlcNAc-1-phosphate transferase
LIGTPIFKKIAIRIGAVDSPSQYRKIHSSKVPRLGGPIIFLAFFGSLYLTAYWSHQGTTFLSLLGMKIQGLFLGSIVILVVGILDDIKGVRPLFKVLGILLAATIAFYFGFQIKIINTPFGIMRFHLMSFPVTAVWLIFTANAINLIDGMDGLATGVAIAASITIFVLYAISGNLVNAILMTSLFGACVGFLIYN